MTAELEFSDQSSSPLLLLLNFQNRPYPGEIEVYTRAGTLDRTISLSYGVSALGGDDVGGDAAGGDGTHTVELAAGQIVTGQDFGNQPLLGGIEGTKWNDLDGDGVRDPDNDFSQTVFDGEDNVIKTIDANNKTATSTFDGDDRETSHVDEAGVLTSSVFDAVGDVIKSFDGLGLTQMFYDAIGRAFDQGAVALFIFL